MTPRQAPTIVAAAVLALAGHAFAADAPAAADAAPVHDDGLVVLDYQSIPIHGYPSIDLAGVHVLGKFNDWLYLGVGAHAPLFKGEYGGFMSFDVTAHAQHDITDRVFADAGLSYGGGGGGNTIAQSKIISGSGAFYKGYAGAGYRFDGFSLGVNASHIRFTDSVIHGTQVDVFFQMPFSYTSAPYASAGRPSTTLREPDDDVLMLGLDNFIQVKPKGSYKGTIDLADVQFDHFIDPATYLFVEGSVGVHGLPIYNQLLGGVGVRARLGPRLNAYAQLGVGSGGYDPEKFDTGPGLLVYPKVFGEYRLGDNVGLALSAGYLFAPRATVRNVTVGAALDFHLGGAGSGGAAGRENDGYRIDIFPQSELHPKIGDRTQGAIKLLTTQVDRVVGPNVYVPIQASIATSRFLGYPGYGEVLAGLGLQTTYSADTPVQGFVQAVTGINVHGLIVKPVVGLNVTLSDRLAIYAQVGKTLSVDGVHVYPERYRFNATNVGLGLSYRFSLPN